LITEASKSIKQWEQRSDKVKMRILCSWDLAVPFLISAPPFRKTFYFLIKLQPKEESS